MFGRGCLRLLRCGSDERKIGDDEGKKIQQDTFECFTLSSIRLFGPLEVTLAFSIFILKRARGWLEGQVMDIRFVRLFPLAGVGFFCVGFYVAQYRVRIPGFNEAGHKQTRSIARHFESKQARTCIKKYLHAFRKNEATPTHPAFFNSNRKTFEMQPCLSFLSDVCLRRVNLQAVRAGDE
jgi:hypothetical protein